MFYLAMFYFHFSNDIFFLWNKTVYESARQAEMPL